MKHSMFCLLTILLMPALTSAQSTGLDNEIRNLDKMEAEAVLKHDTLALEHLWADNFTVNTPYNMVGTRKRGDRINLYYSRFDRTVETVIVHNETLVTTMGNEVVVRKAPMTLAGQTINRRFTHLWMKKNGTWQLSVRHANFICTEMPLQKLQ